MYDDYLGVIKLISFVMNANMASKWVIDRHSHQDVVHNIL
jgi:hypothetical protein